jgi:excisionase family DNA binding protein
MTIHALHPEDWEPYLTKRQVAQRLGFSVRWLEQQVAQAELPAHMIGGQRRFLWSEIQSWIERREASS